MLTYLLETYSADDVTFKTDAATTRYNDPSTVSRTQYTEALVAKSLRCGEIHDHYFPKGVFTESLQKSVSHAMQSFFRTNQGSTLYDLTCHAKSLQALKRGNDVNSKKESGDQ